MRHFSSTFCRWIAAFLVMTVLTSGIAMAPYACPQWTQASVQEMNMVMAAMPCTEMDKEQPVQCAEFQSGADLALEHLAGAPSLVPVTVSLIMPAPQPVTAVRSIKLAAFRRDHGFSTAFSSGKEDAVIRACLLWVDGVEKVWRQYSKCIACSVLSRQSNQSNQKAGGTGAATT